MAKETTDLYKVTTSFVDASHKFSHTFRYLNKKLKIEQIGSCPLSDNYNVKVTFQTVKRKWCDFFSTGEWVKSYSVKNTASTFLVDDFEIEVKYKGGAKVFEKNFHSQTHSNKFEFSAVLISSITKDLGVVNPQYKISKSRKEVLNTYRIFFIDILKKAGFDKETTIPDVSQKNKFAISAIGGGDYSLNQINRCNLEKLVCVHLAGWKIGIVPMKDNMEKFKVQVSSPGKTYRSYKTPSYKQSYDDFGIDKRVEAKKVNSWRVLYTFKELFLGNPDISKIMTIFFKKIVKTPLPSF